MATLLLGAVGAGIGAGFGNLAMGFAIGATIGDIIDRTSNLPTADVGRLTDRRFSGSSYGVGIPRIWGRVNVAANIVWMLEDASGNHFFEHVAGEGGGCGGGPSSRMYYYTATYTSILAQGTLWFPAEDAVQYRTVSLKTIRANDILLYDSANVAGSLLQAGGFEFLPGTEIQNPSPTIVAAKGVTSSLVYALRGYTALTIIDRTTWDTGGQIPHLTVGLETSSVTVGDVFTDLCRLAGIPAAYIDGAEATMAMPGMLLAEREEPQRGIDMLCSVFPYRVIKSDGKIKMVPRGASPVLTVTTGMLGARSGESDAKRLIREQEMPEELPGRIDVTYFDSANNLQTGMQPCMRYDVDTLETESLALPLTLTAAQAVQAGNRVLDERHSQAETIKVSLPPSALKLSPADAILVPCPEGLVRAEIHQMRLAGGSEIVLTCRVDDEYTITQPSGGSTGGTGAGPQPEVVPTAFTVWSGREIIDDHQAAAGFYVAASGEPGWQGGTIYYSPDAGTTWIQAGSVPQRSTFGVATSALANGSTAEAFDDTNTVGVSTAASKGTVASATDPEIQSGRNYALLGSEIVGIGVATLTGGNAYTLSHIRRGMRQTPMTGHTNTDRFVMLSSAVARIPVPAAYIGQTMRVKVVSPGEALGDVTHQTVTIATPTPTATDLALDLKVRIVMIAPVTVQSATSSSVAWTTFDASAHVPAGATVAVLEAEWAMGGPDSGDIDAAIKVRKTSGASVYLVSRGRSSGAEDSIAGANTAYAPIHESGGTRTFDYTIEAPGFNNNAEIRLIGYFAP